MTKTSNSRRPIRRVLGKATLAESDEGTDPLTKPCADLLRDNLYRKIQRYHNGVYEWETELSRVLMPMRK